VIFFLPKTAAIILAAGSSQRFGEDKLMVLVEGRPLVSYSLETFTSISSIQEIILVVASDREDFFRRFLKEKKDAELKKIKIVFGGVTRHESVRSGLLALSSDIEWVVIHDGARPLVSPSMIQLCLQKAQEYGAASLAVPVTETLHRADEQNVAEATIDRTHLWSMQTPQVFRKDDLISLLALKESKNFTDEVSALLEHGKKIYLVENREPNLKVTYPLDLKLVEALLSKVNFGE